jgi:hypothetical protein
MRSFIENSKLNRFKKSFSQNRSNLTKLLTKYGDRHLFCRTRYMLNTIWRETITK